MNATAAATILSSITLPVLRSNVTGIVPGLVERGKIKIGEKGQKKTSTKGTEYQPPKKLEYFRVTTLERGADDNFLTDETIHKAIGAKPTEIPIILMFDEIDRNFNTRFVCYSGKTRWCHGDGENALRIVNQDGDLGAVSCPCNRLDPASEANSRCKIAGVLSVVIRGAETVGGVWKLRTTSWNTCQAILSSLTLIKGITGGRLAGIPLTLTLTPKTGTTPKGESVKVFVVSIEYKGPAEQLLEEGYQKLLQNATFAARMKMVDREAARLLSADLPAAEDADFVEEFVPEQAQGVMGDETQAEQPAATAQATPPKQTKPRNAKPAAKPAPEQAETEPAVPPSGAEAFGLTGETEAAEDTAQHITGPDNGTTPDDEPGDNEQSGENSDDDFNDPF